MRLKHMLATGALALTACVVEYGDTDSRWSEENEPGFSESKGTSNRPSDLSNIADQNNQQIEQALMAYNPSDRINAPIFTSLMPLDEYQALTIIFGGFTGPSIATLCQGGYRDEAKTFVITCLTYNNGHYGALGVTAIDLEANTAMYTMFQSEADEGTRITHPLDSPEGVATAELAHQVF